MESRDHITVYIDTDGLVTVEIPKGVMPDRKAIRSVIAAINAIHFHTASQCCTSHRTHRRIHTGGVTAAC